MHDPQDDSPPVPPERPKNEDCCHGGCYPCIFDLYEDALAQYRIQYAFWQARASTKKQTTMSDTHLIETASAWVARFAPMIPRTGTVLDLACGAGRHTRLLAGLGYRVLAVDVDLSRLAAIAGMPEVITRQADLENAPWPFGQEKFTGVVVANYLHRPLLPRLIDALESGGVLIYETFARGNERFGKPSNPDFLLQPGELLAAVHGKGRVVAYEDVLVSEPKPAAVQRICAVRG